MGVISGNSPGAMAREIAILGIKTDTTGDAKKAQITARGKYLATVFLLSSDRRRYEELILWFKNDYAKQQRNYQRTLTDMHRLMVAFDPTRETPVDRGRNEGLNFGNVVADSERSGDGDHDGGGGTGRKLEFWNCVG